MKLTSQNEEPNTIDTQDIRQSASTKFIEQQDKEHYFEIVTIGTTPFKKATSETNTCFLLGNCLISKLNNTEQKEITRVEKKISQGDWDIILPTIAAMIEMINKGELKNTQN